MEAFACLAALWEKTANWVVFVAGFPMLMRMRTAAVCLALWLGASGCGDSERDQARLLLDRIEAVDIRAPHREREVQLAELEAFRLGSGRLAEVRDLCLEAHRALISAEKQQAVAREALRTAGSAKGLANGELPADSPQVSTAAAAIESSDRQLGHAKRAFPKCQREIRALALRFAERR